MFFFFNDTATTEIYTLSLHDALPIYARETFGYNASWTVLRELIDEIGIDGMEQVIAAADADETAYRGRSEEHTSELQSQSNLVCRLLLEKKKKKNKVVISKVNSMTLQ